MAGNKGKDLLRKALISAAGLLGIPLVAVQETAQVTERVPLPRAAALILTHRLKEGHGPALVAVRDRSGTLREIPNPELYLSDGTPDPEHFDLLSEEVTYNIILNSGRDRMHVQCYGTTGLATNGFNYVALSNTLVTTNPADTTLAGEIGANGLSRAQGAYAHTASTNTTTITKTFTCVTASQACQTAGFFNAASGGDGQHFLGFTQRTLQPNDTITIQLTSTLG